MSIEDVLREMRTDEMRESRRILTQELDEWADVIEAAMREKDEELDFLRSVKESRGRELDEKEAEIERLQKVIELEVEHSKLLVDEIERLKNDLADALDVRRGDGGPTVLSMMKTEIERLREALERIKANRYGLQSLTENGADEKAIAEYWANTAMEYQQIARAALLEVKNV